MTCKHGHRDILIRPVSSASDKTDRRGAMAPHTWRARIPAYLTVSSSQFEVIRVPCWVLELVVRLLTPTSPGVLLLEVFNRSLRDDPLKVWLGIHGKINRSWASKNLSVADRMADLLMAEELGWSTLTFPRRDSLSYFQEQVRIMGFGGTCEKASNRHPDDKGHLTLGPLPTAASREPFQFHADKIFDSSRPEYTQDPTLDVLIFLCR